MGLFNRVKVCRNCKYNSRCDLEEYLRSDITSPDENGCFQYKYYAGLDEADDDFWNTQRELYEEMQSLQEEEEEDEIEEIDTAALEKEREERRIAEEKRARQEYLDSLSPEEREEVLAKEKAEAEEKERKRKERNARRAQKRREKKAREAEEDKKDTRNTLIFMGVLIAILIGIFCADALRNRENTKDVEEELVVDTIDNYNTDIEEEDNNTEIESVTPEKELKQRKETQDEDKGISAEEMIEDVMYDNSESYE